MQRWSFLRKDFILFSAFNCKLKVASSSKIVSFFTGTYFYERNIVHFILFDWNETNNYHISMLICDCRRRFVPARHAWEYCVTFINNARTQRWNFILNNTIFRIDLIIIWVRWNFVLLSLFNLFQKFIIWLSFYYKYGSFSEATSLLLAHNAPVKVKNMQGWNCLMEAVSYGDRIISKFDFLYLSLKFMFCGCPWIATIRIDLSEWMQKVWSLWNSLFRPSNRSP